MFQALKQFVDGLSKTTYSMIASLLANVINIIVNYLFIYGEFGFPRLEVEGAAIGTFVSRVIMFLILFILLFYKTQFKVYFKRLKSYSSGVIKKIFQLGLPTSLQMLFEVSLFTIAIFLSGTIGVKSQAANQIALNLSALTFMVGVGLGVTATIRIGNQKGIGNITYLKTVATSLFLMTLLVELVFAFTFLIFHEHLPGLYISDLDVIKLASEILIIAALFQISDGFQVVLLGILRGLQDVWIPTIICFISYWLIGFPIMYVLGNYYSLGVKGIWIGLLSALTVSAILMFYRYRELVKK
jgi:MATE family multidrug resistance protein